MIKSVNFSHPSSANAVKLKKAKTGCWSVSVSEKLNAIPKLLDGPFESKEEAIVEAEKLPYDWCSFQTF